MRKSGLDSNRMSHETVPAAQKQRNFRVSSFDAFMIKKPQYINQPLQHPTTGQPANDAGKQWPSKHQPLVLSVLLALVCQTSPVLGVLGFNRSLLRIQP